MAYKKGSTQNAILYLRIVKVIFIVLFALLLVYVYYLHTKGILFEQFISLVNQIIMIVKQNPTLIVSLGSYIIVFFLGYYFGKRKK